MALPQMIVIGLLARWGHSVSAMIVAALVIGQLGLMTRLLSDPRKYAPWYNASGTTLYVLGMLAASLGLGGTL